MTKEEAIRNTEYSEEELIDLALAIAEQRAKEWRNESEDSEAWDHHEALMNAFEAIRKDRQVQ